MEKIAIISDVHGNITALNAVLEDIEKKNIKRIFCLGDIVGKCANPDLTIDKVKEKCEIVLKGNIDEIFGNPLNKNKKYWTVEKIGEERVDYLYNLPLYHQFYMSGHLIRLFHSSPYALDYIYNPVFKNTNTRYKDNEIENPLKLFDNTNFLGNENDKNNPNVVGYGHLHTSFIFKIGNKTIFNPGSVGVPIEMLNNDENDIENKFTTMASYLIIEGEYESKELSEISFNICKVPYDIQKEIDYLKNSEIYNKEKTILSLKTGISPI